MQDIPKLCSDNLRVFSENHGIKLKASHAHELVAAFFAYKSNSALKNDPRYSLSNLHEVKIIILAPRAFVDLRRNALKELPFNLPDSEQLCEVVSNTLRATSGVTNTVWTHDKLKWHASLLTHHYQRQSHLKNKLPANFSEEISVENSGEGICLILTPYKQFLQSTTASLSISKKHYLDFTTTVWLERIVGHIDYDNSQITVEDKQLKINIYTKYEEAMKADYLYVLTHPSDPNLYI